VSWLYTFRGFVRTTSVELAYKKAVATFQKRERRLLMRAYTFAKEKHKGQRRDEGTAYIIHPLRAALSLIEETEIHDATVLAAAVLHDVLEDTATTEAQLRRRFGQRIFSLVKAVTRYRSAQESEESKKDEKLKAIRKTARRRKDIRLIKLADALDNMRCWKYIPAAHPSQKKIPRWIDEAKRYIPIARQTHPFFVRAIKEVLKEMNGNL